jgi:hypothetical protein
MRKLATKATKAAKRAPKDLTPKTSAVGGMATVITNLANMRHEMLKSVAQNLRA